MIGSMAILVTGGFILLTAFIDAEHIKKQEYIDSHASRFFQRGFFILAMGLIDPFYLLASLFLFIALFDQVLNSMMGKDFWYLGTTAKWDIIFNRKYFTICYPILWRRDKELNDMKFIDFNFKILYIAIKVITLFSSLFLFLSLLR